MPNWPQLAVLATLAAAGAAAGGYFLWPSGRHLAACPPLPAPVPQQAQAALAAYAGRIRHEVQHEPGGALQESWSDPLTGRTRQVQIRPDGHVVSANGTARDGGWERIVWVLYDRRVSMTHRLRVPAGTSGGLSAADEAQANRDMVAHARARVVGKEVIDGRHTIRLHEVIRPLLRSGLSDAHAPTVVRVDTWVDPLTYVTVRGRFTADGHTATTDEDWLPRTVANVARTRLVIPVGFRHPAQSGTVSTYSDEVTLRARGCA